MLRLVFAAGAVMLPRINQLESENGRLEILDLVARAGRKLALVYFPLSAFLLVAGREVVTFLFTRQETVKRLSPTKPWSQKPGSVARR